MSAVVIEGLRVEYPVADAAPFVAVDGLSLSIEPGEVHALVGESGAGKSTVGNCVMGLLEKPGRIAAGQIVIDGRTVDARSGLADGLRPGRDIGAIFQDPMTSLNPLFTIEEQLGETMRHHLRLGRTEARERSLELLRAVEIPEPERRLRQYPHQLSGGQRQRVVIAAALSCGPRLLVADEPTTALDVSVQARVLTLLRDLARTRSLGVLLITHNMGVVAEIADRVTIMRHGKVIEQGPTRLVLSAPTSAYGRALIGAVPRLDSKLDRFPVTDPQGEREASAQARLGRAAKSQLAPSVLRVNDVDVVYGGGLFSRHPGYRAVEGASFTIERGEIFGIVGESGSGKSTLASVIAGLIAPTTGRMSFEGRDLTPRRPRALRQAIQMIFQDPYSSLNARMRVGRAIQEPVDFFRTADSGGAPTLIEAVGLPAEAGRRFPHAFSGGQRQRISIARALAAEPRLLICDEPTSALDVSVQARVLNLLKDLRDRTGLSILFISHDLSVVRQMCDRIAVMKAGRIVETADAETLFARPSDPYTRDLIRLIPTLDALAPVPSPLPASASGA